MSGRIVALVQGLSGPGGIQRYNRTWCRLLGDYAAARGMGLDVLSFADEDGWFDPRYLSRPLRGCGGNRATYVARALAATAMPYSLLVVGQVDFGPLALLPHLLRPSAPVLAMVYGIEVWRRLPPHKRAGLAIADKILAISAYTASQTARLQGVRHEAVDVLPIPLDPAFAAAVEAHRPTLPPRRPGQLLTISRMAAHDGDKGIDTVLYALPTVRMFAPEVRYTVVGDGVDRPRLERLATSLGVAPIVEFAGKVSEERLHQELGGADLFVLPSRKEGFGIVYLEAMAYGLPVIAGAHGGAPEVVAAGETGYLIEHGDVAALATAITSVVRSRALRASMAAAGERRVATVFNHRRWEERFSSSLDGLLAPAGVARALRKERVS
jgi:glycosyltransferase involved in cell wall biosynthesis